VSDDQLNTFLNRAKAENITIDQAIQMAMARGLPASEAQQLKTRLEELVDNFSATQAVDILQLDRQRSDNETADDAYRHEQDVIQTVGVQVYGANLFRNRALNLTPNLNIPTPANYQLGPGDQLVVNIWGDRTDQLRLTVSPEGSVQLNNLGPVQVNGLTIERASERILNYLVSLYSGLRPSSGSPTTFAEISLGRIRTITVNVTGEVQNPGSYSVSSLATIFNALYATGGPNSIGSYRNIRLIRNNQILTTLDLYDYLINGDQTNNLVLKDQDIIQIMPYSKRATINGQVLRNAVYELLPEQTLKNVMDMAGGFTSQAYSRHVKIHRYTQTERRIVTVPNELFDDFILQDGDVINVDEILDRYENKISISGAVWRTGDFELNEGMTLRDLILKADGLRPDAFMSRGLINRVKPDLSFEQISFNVNDVMNNPNAYDILLNREDAIIIRGIQELRDEATVEIEGSIRDSGIFLWLENMTLEDLVLKANGFRESAALSRIEISRRIKLNDGDYTQTPNLIESFIFEVDNELTLKDADKRFILQPYDYVYVHRRPDFRIQQFVTLEGEVRFPGRYAISNTNEKLSDIIQRAGGLTQEAYIKGARLNRLESSIDRAPRSSSLNLATATDEIIIEDGNRVTNRIAMNLESALRNTSSQENLLIRDGDVLRVPRKPETVRVSGAVMQDVEVRYIEGASYSYYVNRAGGYTSRAHRSRAYVIYTNGDLDRRKRLFWMTVINPEIEPGAEIVVPLKAENPNKMSTAEFISMASIVVSMSTTLLLAIDRYRR
jgi:protein involved in polysaccharide export with SLBB domain